VTSAVKYCPTCRCKPAVLCVRSRTVAEDNATEPARAGGGSCYEPQTKLKLRVGGLLRRQGRWRRGRGSSIARRLDGARGAPPGGAVEAGAAAAGSLDGARGAPPGGSVEAGAAAAGSLDGARGAPPGGSVEAGAAAEAGSLDGARDAPQATQSRPGRRRRGRSMATDAASCRPLSCRSVETLPPPLRSRSMGELM